MAELAGNAECVLTEVESGWLKLFTGVVVGQACNYEIIRTLNHMICHYACASHVIQSGKPALSILEIADVSGFSRSFVTSYTRKLVEIGVVERHDTDGGCRYASRDRWHDLHFGFRVAGLTNIWSSIFMKEVTQLAKTEGFHFGQSVFFAMMLDALRGVKENTVSPRASMKQVAIMLLVVEHALLFGGGIRYRDIENRLHLSNADVHSIVMQLVETERYFTQRDPDDRRCQLIFPRSIVLDVVTQTNREFCETWASELAMKSA